jgi:hypothetical protein
LASWDPLRQGFVFGANGQIGCVNYTDLLMRKYRKLLILALLLAAGGIGLWTYWAWQAPPLAARVLPDGDRLLYVDLRPLHLWDSGGSKPLQLEGDYQQFVDQTGIQFERDLSRVAIVWRDTSDGRDTESAAIFIGRFDRARLQRYLQGLSSHTDDYHHRPIYVIPHEGHVVRVAILDDKTIATTNMAAPEAITGMVDRWDHSSGEPALLAQYYRRIPIGSLAWLIDRFPPGPGATQLPDGLSFSFLENKVAVVSARYNGDLLLRADVLAANESDARRLIDSATAFLSLYRGISNSFSRGSDHDVKAALESIQAEQKGNVVVFSASLSKDFLKKMVQEAQPQISPATPTPSSSPLSEPKLQRRRSKATLHR